MSFVMKFKWIVLFSLTLLTGFAPQALAQNNALQELKNYLTNPRQVGSGPLTYLGFKVYEAQYFVTDDVGLSGFALRLNYARKIANTDLIGATIKQMARLGASDADISQWKIELEKIFPDVDQGHYLMAIYNSNGATTFLHNGRMVGKVIDPHFAKMFFSIWFDPKTNAPDLRSKLLGDLCPPSIISVSCLK
jgi:hypothetical protein